MSGSKLLVRRLEESDLPQLHEIVLRGWEYDVIPMATLREKTIDAGEADRAHGFVASQNDRIIGFIQGSMGLSEPNLATGFVRLLVVDPAYRNRGVGSLLLQAAEASLGNTGATAYSVGDCPHNYFMPGTDFRATPAYCFFHKHGYVYARQNHNLQCDLHLSHTWKLEGKIRDIEMGGMSVVKATMDDWEATAKFLDENWAAWKTEAYNALTRPLGSLYVVYSGDEVVAFSGCGGNNTGMPWFGPMGTKPGTRGKGLGGLLLRLCLRDLHMHGFDRAIIPWVGPIRFYARYTGATLDRCFYVYRKDTAAK